MKASKKRLGQRLLAVAAASVMAMSLGYSSAATAGHISSDGLGGYYTSDGHISSDGLGGYYTPDGGHISSDGLGGFYTP